MLRKNDGKQRRIKSLCLSEKVLLHAEMRDRAEHRLRGSDNGVTVPFVKPPRPFTRVKDHDDRSEFTSGSFETGKDSTAEPVAFGHRLDGHEADLRFSR